MKYRTASALLAPAALATAVTLASASAASAAPARPAAASSVRAGQKLAGPYCGGDVCAEVYLPAGARNFGSVVVQVWAWHSTFTGHFELQVPGVRNPYNSGDAANRAGVTGHLFLVPNDNGRFTVTAWKKAGPRSWASIGVTGFNGAVF